MDSPDVASCLITSIKGLLSRLWHVRINHIARENDMVENMIAKEAKLWPIGLHIFDRPPKSDEAAIAEEVVGSLTIESPLPYVPYNIVCGVA
ncbi:hypothetical protein GOBAR_AA20814 [Gossypium barbadense]|uniref:RNase H type-1 domain-containing protein n=1 Tax=Gossypium barbadense TaxID=3634 RepID=A0A2P5X934_GOSBA|nr:hypothetical protein GOBAR_AA20814 [Gossypium barbadense]